MPALAGVRRRVPTGRAVAAADLAALQADPQMQPLAAGRKALLAAFNGLRQFEDLHVFEMAAGRRRSFSLLIRLSAREFW
jgi:hypothetical protein